MSSKRIQHRGRVTRSTQQRPLVARRAGVTADQIREGASRAVAAAHQRAQIGRLQGLMAVDPKVAQTLMQMGQQIIPVDDQNGDGCRHRTGQMAFDPGGGGAKVWRCDQCEWLYQLIDPGDGSDPIMVGVE